MDKPKFNIIDALIILAVVLVAVAGVLFLGGGQSAKTEEGVPRAKTIEYKLQFTEREAAVKDMFVKAKENGETVWVGEKERVEATIHDLIVEPAKRISVDMKNEQAVWAEVPDLYDVTVTLRSTGSETEEEVLIGSTPIRVGHETTVKGKGFAGYGFVIDLKVLEGEE